MARPAALKQLVDAGGRGRPARRPDAGRRCGSHPRARPPPQRPTGVRGSWRSWWTAAAWQTDIPQRLALEQKMVKELQRIRDAGGLQVTPGSDA